MTTPPTDERASVPAWPWLTPDNLCYQWDEGIEGEISDATTTTRAQAQAFYARQVGCDFTEVRCVARYVVLHTLQDVWDGPGRDRYADDLCWGPEGRVMTPDEAWARTPQTPPDGWRPSEGMACWSVCRRDHPRARKVWMCEVRGDDLIPDTPPKVVSA